MSARVFVHPRCTEGPAMGALAASMQERGYDTSKILVGPPDHRGYCDIVRHRGTKIDGALDLERLDGHAFVYHPKQPLLPVPPTEAA